MGKGQVDHHVGVSHQTLDRAAVQDVAAPIHRFGPTLSQRIERPPGHPENPLDGRFAFQGGDGRDPDLARRPGDRDS